MKIIKKITKYLALLFTFAYTTQAFSIPSRATAGQANPFKVIQLSGEDVPDAIGYRLQRLSLAAVVDGQLEPIPFQIDEYNIGGAVYFDDWGVDIQGVKDIFDSADKILFVLKDAGQRKSKDQVYDGEVIAEFELQGEQGNRFVYLVKDSKLRSDEQYVRYSSEMALVETDFYNLSYDTENHLKWKDFSYKNYVGEPPLDTMKIRFKGGVLSEHLTTSLNNDQIVAEPAGEIIGPIRTTTQLEVTVWFMNLPMLSFGLQQHHYPKSLHYDVRMVIPFHRKLVVDPVVSFSLDGNKLLGATIHSALGPKQGGVVDGKVDDQELQMIENGIDVENNWIWVSTQRNLDILAQFDFLEGSEQPLSMQIQDSFDEIDPPEKFAGQLPNVGYIAHNLPKSGFFGCVISVFFNDHFEGQPSEFVADVRTTPDIKVNSLTMQRRRR